MSLTHQWPAHKPASGGRIDYRSGFFTLGIDYRLGWLGFLGFGLLLLLSLACLGIVIIG